MQLCINVNVATASLRFLCRFDTTSWMSLKSWMMKTLNCSWSTRSKSLNSKEDISLVMNSWTVVLYLNCYCLHILTSPMKTTHMLKYLIVIKKKDCYQTGFLKTWPVCHWLDKQVIQFTCWAAQTNTSMFWKGYRSCFHIYSLRKT